jgi:hypothetical protein
MASSGNFPLWSPLIKDSTNLSQGNTRFTGATNNRGAMTSFAIPSGTKFYVELLVKQANYYNIVFGIANPEFNLATYDESDASLNGFIFSGYNNNDWRTNPLVNGSRQGWNLLSDDTTSLRVMALTINRVDNEIKCYFDNTLITNGTISISATETYHLVCAFAGGANANIHMNINGGHDSTGAGDFSAGSATDENGFGEFQNTPPTGFLAPSSANLPISADIDPAGDDGADENPTKQFGVVTYTGNATTGQAITGMGCQPDLVWAKMRSSTQSNFLSDTSRGINKFLFSDNTNAEGTGGGYATVYSSFDSDGFTLGTSGSGPNDSGRTYVAWGWRANGGVTSSNSSGSITSTVQANTKSGFSIITYTGTGSNATIGHSLSAKPDFFIVKSRSGGTGRNWAVYHSSQGATKYAELDSNGPFYTSSLRWNNTEPTNSLISLGTTASVNANTENFVCYAWHNVEGYSKFGSFEGNSDTDGPMIVTNFRPRLVFCKSADASENWQVRDTARSTFNADSQVRIYWNSSGAEGSASTASPIDFLSNGFKVRGSNSEINSNTIVYGAWADVPFKYNNTF